MKGQVLVCLIVLLSDFLKMSVHGEQYIIAMPKTRSKSWQLWATIGQHEGSVQLQFLNQTWSYVMKSYSKRHIEVPTYALADTEIDNQTVTITTSNDAINIYLYSFHAAFSPLPVDLCGTKYIIPSCQAHGHVSVLVIASIGLLETEVEVTFRLNTGKFQYKGNNYYSGDSFREYLEPSQTFSFRFIEDLSGTVVQTSSPVAVFLGSTLFNYMASYDQLLPVKAHGNEYALAVDGNQHKYRLQIVSVYSDVELHFSDGSVIRSPFYSKGLEVNATLYFNNTKPVMATLCRRYNKYYYSGFLVLLPLYLYRYPESSLFYGYSTNTVKILTETSSEVEVSRYFQPEVPVDWTMIPGSEYKVGTCTANTTTDAMSIASNSRFTILAYGQSHIYNGGYSFTNASVSDTLSSATTNSGESINATTIIAISCGIVIVALLVVGGIIFVFMRRNLTSLSSVRTATSGRSSEPGGLPVSNPSAVYEETVSNERASSETEHDYETL